MAAIFAGAEEEAVAAGGWVARGFDGVLAGVGYWSGREAGVEVGVVWAEYVGVFFDAFWLPPPVAYDAARVLHGWIGL